jgi:hypothetical protein
VFDNGDGKMCPVVYQPGYVIFRHLWQLLLEDAFQSCQDYKALPLTIIIDDAKLDLSPSFLKNGSLISGIPRQFERKCKSNAEVTYLLRKWDDPERLFLERIILIYTSAC